MLCKIFSKVITIKFCLLTKTHNLKIPAINDAMSDWEKFFYTLLQKLLVDTTAYGNYRNIAIISTQNHYEVIENLKTYNEEELIYYSQFKDKFPNVGV